MPKRKISNVWGFFTRDQNKKLAKCDKCGKEYKTSGNTSNLLDHLKRFNPEFETSGTGGQHSGGHSGDESSSVASSSSKRSISPYFKRQISYERDSQRKKEIDKALMVMVATDFQPFNIVEDQGFRAFVKTLDPRYELPSKTTLRDKHLKDYYQEGTLKLLGILEGVDFVSLTCDLWSSRANDSFITVTCHFIDSAFAIRCAVLSTDQMLGSHTAQNIAYTIIKIMQKWNLENKIVCIVTDNAPSMIKACQILKIRHHPYFAHTLNLVVQDALKEEILQHVLSKCKELVRFFKCSNVATEQLRNEQKQQNKPELKLIQEVPTRWNSALSMVKRFLEVNDALTVTLSRIPKAPRALSLEDTVVLSDLIKLLSTFDEATNKISGDIVTNSLIIPITFGIYNHLVEVGRDVKTSEGKRLLQCLTDGVVTRLFPYEECSIPRIATLLDPRLKKEAFRSADNAKAAVSLLQTEMTLHVRRPPEEASELQPATSGGQQQEEKSSPLFNFMVQRIADKSRSGTVDAIIVIRQYLERANTSADSDPLLFWKVNGLEVNPLQHCAKTFLGIPATLVPSERVFSKTGQIISDRRSRIKPKNVDMLIFLNQNKWLIDY